MSTETLSWQKAVRASDLPTMTKTLLFTLTTYLDEFENGCWPGKETLATAMGSCVRTITNHIDIARQKGWIHIEARGRGKHYFMLWPDRADRSWHGNQLQRHRQQIPVSVEQGQQIPLFAPTQESGSTRHRQEIPPKYILDSTGLDSTPPPDIEIDDLGKEGCANPGAEPPDLSLEQAASLDEQIDRMLEAGGKALCAKLRTVRSLARQALVRWLEQGADLELDILPSIEDRMFDKEEGRAKSWAYFDKPIALSMALRETPLPKIKPTIPKAIPSADAQPPANDDPSMPDWKREQLRRKQRALDWLDENYPETRTETQTETLAEAAAEDVRSEAA